MLHVRTPLLPSAAFARAVGGEAWVKLESAQPTGSFKIRGIGHMCKLAAERGIERLVASSGGNAGIAVAFAGAQLGLDVVVVVPETTPERMRALIRSHGATVSVHGAVWDEAHERALDLSSAPGCNLIPPFDHPEIWDGHATLVDELADAIAEPEWIVVAVGGGGLLGGVLVGLERVGWNRTKVLAVETEGANSFALALAAGEVVELDAIRSVAKSLGARRVSAAVLERALARGVEAETVSDADALASVVRFADDHRQLVEPACGAALAAGYHWHRPLGSSVVVIACGGAGVTTGDLVRWRDAG